MISELLVPVCFCVCPVDPKDHVWTAEEDAILSGDNTGREFRQLASRLSYDQCKARIAFLSS